MDDELPLPDFDAPEGAADGPGRWKPLDPIGPDSVASAIAAQNARVSQPEPPRSAVLPDVRAVRYEDVPHPGFEARFFAALRVPLHGLLWTAACAAAFLVLFFSLRIPRLSLFALPATASLAAGLFATYFGQAAAAAMRDEGGPLKLEWSVPSRESLGMLGLAVAFTSAAMLSPAFVLSHHGSWLRTPALILFLLYTPIALLGVGISGSLLTLFRPLLLARTVWAVRARFAKSAMLMLANLPPLAAALFGEGVLFLLGAVLGSILLACSAGVLGYQMGCLPASDPMPFRRFRR